MKDDVLHEAFTKHLLFKTSSEAESIWKRTHPELDPPHFQSDLPREGPYLLIGTTLHKVFKLYPDVYNAFVYGTLQSGDTQM